MIEQLVLCESREQALALLAEGRGPRVLAGGTDLVPMYVDDETIVEVALDIRSLTHMDGIADDATAVTIGALTSLDQVAQIDQPWLGALRDGAACIGSKQTRVRGTIGGNVCRASPSGDTLAALLALDARFSIGRLSGSRTVAAREFFAGPGATVLGPDELLEHIAIEVRQGASAYVRSTVRRSMDLATVGVAVAVTVSEDGDRTTSVAVSGAAPTPLLASDAHHDGDRQADLEALEQHVQDLIRPIDDVRGSAWYRRQLVRPLLEEAIDKAHERLDA